MQTRFNQGSVGSLGVMAMISFLVVAWGPGLSEQNHYCSISKDHTLCKFQVKISKFSRFCDKLIYIRPHVHVVVTHHDIQIMYIQLSSVYVRNDETKYHIIANFFI